MVQNKAAMKRYDNKESDHNNHKIDFFLHDVVNPNFKRSGMSCVSGKSSLEMRNDYPPKAKYNLVEAKGDDIIVAVIFHVKIVTNVSK